MSMDWMAVLKTVAPWIATAFGGPLGGLAVDAVAGALGVSEKTTDAVKAAISGATPEQLLALKKADQDFALQMQALGFKQITDLEAIAAGDRDSARKMQIGTHSMVPALLTWVIISSFATVIIMLFLRDVPSANRDIIVYMVGQLSGFTAAVIAFWFGTTRESTKKTEWLAQSQPIGDQAR